MKPTNELRFVELEVPASLQPKVNCPAHTVRILQQKWIPEWTGDCDNTCDYEWRDVPVVKE